MREVNRRGAMKLAASLAVVDLGSPSAQAQDRKAKEPPPLDAVFRIEVTAKGVINFRFETPGTADQSFESTEYRYAVLDKDGVQLGGPEDEKVLFHTPVTNHTTDLLKGKRSVSDYSDYAIAAWLKPGERLKSGEEYFLVVSVRNLTGLAKFKAP